MRTGCANENRRTNTCKIKAGAKRQKREGERQIRSEWNVQNEQNGAYGGGVMC